MSIEPNRLFVPALAPVYRSGHDGVETLLRLVAGGFLVIHGAGKIVDPFGAVQMVEGLGFYPGVLWSPLLAITEFFGGILLAIGLLTRPAAFALAYTMGVAMWLTVIGPAVQSGNTVAGFLPAYDAFDVNAWRTPLWQFALLGASLALLFAGSGTLAFDRAIFGRPLPALRPLPRQHDAD